MSEHYDFHYQPTGSGAISGQQVLEQTEDAINELGDYVNDNVGGAMDVAQQALETAQNAEQDAQTALDTANSFSSAIQSAQQDASTALSTAQTAQTTASNANNTAIQAQQDASSAVTTANNASGQVSTLSGTVTALGQRVTTAEGNIGQNTSDITALTTRVGTAEGNITTLQNDVTIAQGNASSAMATAGQVKQQAFVFRYSSTALVASSTNSNTLLDNTDNLKVGDKVIDSNGVLFSVTAIDTANSTFTIGTTLIDLAQDSDVVHKSGDETVGGKKTFSENITCFSNSDAKSIICKTPLSTYDSTNTVGDNTKIRFLDKNNNSISYIMQRKLTNGSTDISLNVSNTDSNNQPIEATLTFVLDSANEPRLSPGIDNTISIGRPTFRYKSFYGMNYYYGSNNVEFSTKFVTTDTTQTISGNKTFSSNVNVYNSDSATDTANIILKNSKAERGSTTDIGEQTISFLDKDNAQIGQIKCEVDANGVSTFTLNCTNSSNSSSGIRLRRTSTGTFLQPTFNNGCNLGTSGYRWYDVQTRAVNNLEPSSLSLPGYSGSKIDISSYITNLTGGNNNYTVPSNGYIFVRTNNGTYLKLTEYPSGVCSSVCSQTADDIGTFLPVNANRICIIAIKCSSIDRAYFIPCQGNV